MSADDGELSAGATGYSLGGIIGLWAIASAVIGFYLSRLEWGNPDGFHGNGIPFPTVCWDIPEGNSQHVDYPSPFALPLNIAAVFLMGIVLFLIARLIMCISRRRRA